MPEKTRQPAQAVLNVGSWSFTGIAQPPNDSEVGPEGQRKFFVRTPFDEIYNYKNAPVSASVISYKTHNLPVTDKLKMPTGKELSGVEGHHIQVALAECSLDENDPTVLVINYSLDQVRADVLSIQFSGTLVGSIRRGPA